MPAKSKLAVFILHYGRTELTARLYRQLVASDPELAGDIMVFDNHAAEAWPGPFLRAEKNLYWPGALEKALSMARDNDYTHLWFMNNDLLFVSAAPYLSRAWKRLQRLEEKLGPIGIYSPSVTLNQYHPQMISKPDRQYSLVKYIDGIAPLINIEASFTSGGLDYADNPYGYGVDVWLSLRMENSGFKLLVDHQLVMRHNYHSTAKTLPGFMDKAAAAEHLYLQKRLGANYRSQLEQLKQYAEDRDEL